MTSVHSARLAAAALVVAVLAAIGVVLTGPTAPAKALATPSVTAPTPVLSARRVAPLLAGAVADAGVAHSLGDLLASGPDRTCLVVSVGGRTIYQHNATEPLTPASNEKLLTATAVLSVLGPDSRFTTSVVAATPPRADVVSGNLWLVGGGDPLLATKPFLDHLRDPKRTSTSLEALADAVVAAGVRRVDGSVVGDGSRYDDVRYVPDWPHRYVTQHQIGPLSALTVNDNLTTWTTPEPLDGDPGATVAADPAAAAAATFTRLLEDRGVTVGGAAGSGNAPAHPTDVAHVTSPPLSQIVTEMLRHSDNQTAEMLTKELGLRRKGHGTTAAGVAAITDELTRLGLPVDGTVRVDGSGLDADDTATCSLLAAALDRAGPSSPLADGLPVAAKSGTLLDRFEGTAGAGRVRAKTGTLPDVSALSGFVTAQPGVSVTFAMIANGAASAARLEHLEDSVATSLVAYPPGVDLAAAGPQKPT